MEGTCDASVPAGPLLCFPRLGPSEAQAEHEQTPRLALALGLWSWCWPSMRRLPCPSPGAGGGGGGMLRRRPSMRRSPCPSPVEHAQTLVRPRAASGLGVEMVCPEIL